MARRRQPGGVEPKRRSRKGCWPCKARKVKCGEEHPACENCFKSGDVCDYSVRLNWEGRRSKRFVTNSNKSESPTLSTKRSHWHHRNLDTTKGQITESAMETNHDSKVSRPFYSQPKKATTCAFSTHAEQNTSTASSNDGEQSLGNAFIFIDESCQLQSGSTNREAHIKKCIAASKGLNSSRSSHTGSQLGSSAFDTCRECRESEKSTTELAKLDHRLCQSATRSADCPVTVSSITWLPYFSTAKEARSPTASLYCDDAVHNSECLRSSASPEFWALENMEPHELAKQSGYLWQGPDPNRFRDPLSNSHVACDGIGEFCRFDGGRMDDALLLNAGNDVDSLLYKTYFSRQSIVGFGEGAVVVTQAERASRGQQSVLGQDGAGHRTVSL